ncbi:MAG: OmpA family protein [Cyclobacteriaceae bacterium]|nr:OmpA family protein [Cyclobacteriaceae bacterium]MDW8331640.1 OmpA family protein [Cyclobacteriaceae bacterium]
MKVVLLAFFLWGLSMQLYAQPAPHELEPGYYVVVAAYAHSRENYASRFTKDLQDKGLSAQYGFNAQKNLFFVYLSYHTDLRSSLIEMKKVREQGKFTDAWVRVVAGLIAHRPEPVTQQVMQLNSQTGSQPVVAPAPAPQPDPAEKKEEITVEQEEKIIQYPVMTLGNTEVFLSLFDATTNRVIDGEVQVIDTERNRLITKVKGNEYLMLPDPKTQSGMLTLIAEVFGYRKQQVEINYPLPLKDTIKPYIELMGTTLAVLFDMVRYRRGDRATLYNVYFFNDAAIMLPESKYELTQLLEMMKENPRYRIRLHGHTNGNYHGKILYLGPDKNFFSLTGARERIGSAKDLSYERAETIKEYLMTNGISGDRIEIKAWGGKRPLYDRHGVNARKNVRVEVEVLAD